MAQVAYRPGDIIAVRGKRMLSRLIEDFSGVISHVGLVTSMQAIVKPANPSGLRLIVSNPMVTQALMPRVATLTLAETLERAAYAYALQPLAIPKADLDSIVAYVKGKEGVGYDYRDLLWQACDKAWGSQWFTTHLASDKLDICSELVAFGYGTKGYTFNVPRRAATPTEIFDYALGHPREYAVARI